MYDLDTIHALNEKAMEEADARDQSNLQGDYETSLRALKAFALVPLDVAEQGSKAFELIAGLKILASLTLDGLDVPLNEDDQDVITFNTLWEAFRENAGKTIDSVVIEDDPEHFALDDAA